MRNPASFTAAVTIVAVGGSLAAATVAMLLAGYSDFLFAYLLSAAIPAVAAPLTIYPLVRANHRLSQVQSDLEQMARTDVLTDLPNRRAFFEHAERLFRDADRQVAAMMIDLDNFKSINDMHGHIVGDRVLAEVAAAIRRTVSGHGAGEWTVARVGGEEFAILLAGATPASLARLAERIGEDVRALRCGREEDDIRVSVSIGVAMRKDGAPVDAVLKEADDASYVAKRAGRDRWSLAASEARPPLAVVG